MPAPNLLVSNGEVRSSDGSCKIPTCCCSSPSTARLGEEGIHEPVYSITSNAAEGTLGLANRDMLPKMAWGSDSVSRKAALKPTTPKDYKDEDEPGLSSSQVSRPRCIPLLII